MKIYTDNDLLKILKYISFRKKVKFSTLVKKFSFFPMEEIIPLIHGEHYICCDAEYVTNKNGFGHYEYKPDSVFRLNTSGREIIEHYQQEQKQFWLIHFLLPVVIALMTTAITLVTTLLLKV